MLLVSWLKFLSQEMLRGAANPKRLKIRAVNRQIVSVSQILLVLTEEISIAAVIDGNEGNNTHKREVNKQDLKAPRCINFETSYFLPF